MTFDYSIHYQQWHDDSVEHRTAKVTELRELMSDVAGDVSTGRALDIGCGVGFMLEALSTLGFDAEGMDSDPAQAAKCRTAGLNVTESGDIGAFAGRNFGAFDLITMFDLLEHIPVAEQLDTLRHVRAMLRPGGALVIQTPNALSPIAAYQRWVDWTHTSSFTTVSIRPLLLNAGFSTVAFRPDSLSFTLRRPRLRLRIVRAWWRFVVRAELGGAPIYREMPLARDLVVVARAD